MYLLFRNLVYNCSVFVGECFHSYAPGDVRPETNPNHSLERSPHVFQYTKVARLEDGLLISKGSLQLSLFDLT